MRTFKITGSSNFVVVGSINANSELATSRFRAREPSGPYQTKRNCSLPQARRNVRRAVFAGAFSALINEVSVTSGTAARRRLSRRGQFKAAVITLTRRA